MERQVLESSHAYLPFDRESSAFLFKDVTTGRNGSTIFANNRLTKKAVTAAAESSSQSVVLRSVYGVQTEAAKRLNG